MTHENNECESAAELWEDYLKNYGVDKAVTCCINHLEMEMECEHSEADRQFSRDLFALMYEATAHKFAASRIVYPYDFKTANERMETSFFHKNREKNQVCAQTIDAAISASNYKVNHYNLELAAMVAISKYGFERVNDVLARALQIHAHDGRYSKKNKEWANGIQLPAGSVSGLRSHATLVEDFTTYARRLYTDLSAERFALPGEEAHGELVSSNGYRILRAFMVNDHEGYVIAYNSDAVSPYVCWQLYIRDGEPSYNWGIYGDEKAAMDGYCARVFVAVNREEYEK